MITAMVVDDEPYARTYLKHLLENNRVTVIGEADSATTALLEAERLQPDILFLDIQMPGLTGMQLAAAIHHTSANSLIVFVTGYSEHALTAFEQGALDYLVKPVTADRLAKTLARATARLADKRSRHEAVKPLETIVQTEATTMARLPVREDYSVRLIRIEEIYCACARDKKVFVRTRENEYRTYYTLTQLEQLLPPSDFLRVHDSCIVAVEQIEEILFLGNHTYAIKLANGDQLPVGRSRFAVLKQRLNLP